jgi:hypothetical protein
MQDVASGLRGVCLLRTWVNREGAKNSGVDKNKRLEGREMVRRREQPREGARGAPRARRRGTRMVGVHRAVAARAPTPRLRKKGHPLRPYGERAEARKRLGPFPYCAVSVWVVSVVDLP